MDPEQLRLTASVTATIWKLVRDMRWAVDTFAVSGRKVPNGVQVSIVNVIYGHTFIVRDTFVPGISEAATATQCRYMLNAMHSSHNALKWGDYTAY
jgi:hypothetical protein